MQHTPEAAAPSDTPKGGRLSITSAAAESAGIQEEIRTLLSQNVVRVMDLFTEWDENNDHVVSKAEFRKAMTLLGVTASRPHVDAVFDFFDVDRSGTITYTELVRSNPTAQHARNASRPPPAQPPSRPAAQPPSRPAASFVCSAQRPT